MAKKRKVLVPGQDESPLAKRPPRPGLGLVHNELSASVRTFLVATCAHRKQLAGGRDAVGLWGGSFLHKTNGAQSQLKWKAPWPRRQDTGVNPREATRRQQGLSGGAAGIALEAPVSCVTV